MSGKAMIIILALAILGMGTYSYSRTGSFFCATLPGEGPCWYGGYPR